MTNKPTETYSYGIQREWSDHNRIVIISTQGDMSPAAVDAWADLVIQTAREWPPHRKIYILHDLSSRYQGFTPYSRQRAEDIYAAVPDWMTGCIAVVVTNTLITRLISLFLRRRKGQQGQFEERIFTSRDEGLVWLREKRNRES